MKFSKYASLPINVAMRLHGRLRPVPLARFIKKRPGALPGLNRMLHLGNLFFLHSERFFSGKIDSALTVDFSDLHGDYVADIDNILDFIDPFLSKL